jgi:hypothetical protein
MSLQTPQRAICPNAIITRDREATVRRHGRISILRAHLDFSPPPETRIFKSAGAIQIFEYNNRRSRRISFGS